MLDDGSTDRTDDVARAANCTVVSHAKNQGIGAAIRTAIHYAISAGYEILVVVNGTGKTPARCIPDLVRPLAEEGYDFVQGSRYLRGGTGGNLPLHRSIGTRVHSTLFSLCLGHTVTDGTSGFRAFRLSIFNDPRFRIDEPWLNRYELEPYLYYQSVALGYRVKEVPVEILYPKAGRYTRMRMIIDWWRITRPLVYLKLGIKR